MEAESEPYVRLATLRTLHRVVADLNAARSLAGTLQAVVEGAVHGLGFDAAAVSLVRPDGDLVVAAVWELEESAMGGPSVLLGQVGSRESWDRLLGVSDHWGTLRFLPYDRGWAVASDIPRWIGDGPMPVYANDWHPADGLLAPMYSAGGDLLGVLSVDRPRSGKRPGAWTREALEMFSLQASIAIGNARLRAEMQRALARLEKEQQALRASEESFRQAFEYAPSGMAITELHGAGRGQLTRVNDALCRLLGRPRAVLRQQSFADLVHPDDRALLERTSAESGRAELRLSRRDGGYQWVCLRNSIVADAAEGPSFLLTHVEDIEDRKRHELQLAHRASHDALTGLPNGAELKARLGRRLCGQPQSAAAVAGPQTGPADLPYGGGGFPAAGYPGAGYAVADSYSAHTAYDGLEGAIRAPDRRTGTAPRRGTRCRPPARRPGRRPATASTCTRWSPPTTDPGTRPGRARSARAHRPSSRKGWPSSSATSTASSRSTTGSGTTRATPSWSRSPAGSAGPCGTATRWPGSAVTSSWCWPTASGGTRPRTSPTGCGTRSSRRCGSTAGRCGSASAWGSAGRAAG